MIYFTRAETTAALIYSILLGAIFGLFYRSIGEIFDFLSSILRLFPDSIKMCRDRASLSIKNYIFRKNKIKKGRILYNVLDFFYFSFLGVLTILLVYAALDGVFRIFVPVTVLLSFFIISNTVGKAISRGSEYALKMINLILIYILSFLLRYPIRLFDKLSLAINNYRKRIHREYVLKKSKKIINKKINEIKRI